MFSTRMLRFAFALTAVCLLVTAAAADSLQLKNGSVIKGKYLGGTATEVAFQVGSTTQRYAVGDVESITFDEVSRIAPAPKPAVTPAPAPVAPQLAPRPTQTRPPATAPRPSVAPAAPRRERSCGPRRIQCPTNS